MRYNKKEEIGKLRERIIVQSVSRTVGTTGFGVETWSNFAEVWAIVDYKGVNKEEIEGGKITALSQVRVTCRNRTDINEQQRIIWMDKYYQIDNMYLHLFCSFAQNYV
jgi:head-tail adaptor